MHRRTLQRILNKHALVAKALINLFFFSRFLFRGVLNGWELATGAAFLPSACMILQDRIQISALIHRVTHRLSQANGIRRIAARENDARWSDPLELFI